MQEDGEVVVLVRMGKVGAAEAMEEVRGGEGEAGRREAVTAVVVTLVYGLDLTEATGEI